MKGDIDVRVKCEYCGNYILDTEENCSVCGAPNEHMVRSGDGIPKTIEDLKQYAVSKGLPLKQMRFFIGEDIKEPRAFGIYEDIGGDFIVYKNKSNGERVVRYRGSDEAYAVNELYQKMRSEVTDQKTKIAAGEGKIKKQKRGRGKGFLVILAIIIVGVIGIFSSAMKVPDNGYYLYEDDYFYTQDMGENWFEYEDSIDNWYAISGVDNELYDNWKKYKIADLEEEATTQTIYYPDIKTSDFWDDNDMDQYDYQTDNYDDYDTQDDGWDNDNWDDDSWDDDDLDWDSSFDWNDSSMDWDSDW